jgi:hypothetical protein
MGRIWIPQRIKFQHRECVVPITQRWKAIRKEEQWGRVTVYGDPSLLHKQSDAYQGSFFSTAQGHLLMSGDSWLSHAPDLRYS